ncbi:MAG: ComF family protein [Ruminococcus sp.]|nr:ComF family protein [Ruminococcus sp.]
MIKPFSILANFIKETFYPSRCPYCGTILNKKDYACDKCKKLIPKRGVSHGVTGGYRCTSALPYDGIFKKTLINFKFNSKPQYADQLAFLMYNQIKVAYPDMIFDYITFVPMHKKDEFERGYNQSELLAKCLSEHMKTPCVNTLEKIRHTEHQHDVEPKKRKTNLKGAFKVCDKDKVKDKHILLVDDVVTTRSTLGECAKTLSKAKPAQICCVTLLTTADLF